MKSPFHTLLLLLLGVCFTASAQSTSPLCAQLCLVSAFETNTCTLFDQACICTNAVFQSKVTACVATTCTIPEMLVARNISLTVCGVRPRDHGQDYTILSIVMALVPAAFVIMRFAFKATVSRVDIGYDDWCALLSMIIFSIATTAINLGGTNKNGLGHDIWTLTPQQITNMLMYFYISTWLYFFGMTFLKLTLIFFYIRVFPSIVVQRVLWSTVVFVVVWGAVFVIVTIFQCQPISYYWTKWDGLHEGTCLDLDAIVSSNAAISVALDFWILGIPLWQLWGLKMHWKKKVSVALMFGVGTFVTIVSILRLQSLVNLSNTTNPSWEFYDVVLWSTIEAGVGMMCACLPTLRLLLVKLFPILGSSSVRSEQYYRYDRGNELNNIGEQRRPQYNDAVVSTPRNVDFDPEDRITVETSYKVQHTHADTDEVSLVSHREKNRP